MRILSFCLLLLCSRASALYGYGFMRCVFNSRTDVVYLAQVYFNKMLLAQYNSTEGKYTGYTEKTKEVADELNKSKSFLEQEKKNYQQCKDNAPLAFDVLSKGVEPTVKLRSVETESSKHMHMLICSAYNFYPKRIKLSWLRDGQEVTTDVMSTQELANGNWLYQIHSYLEYTPSPGEKISCMVEHASFMVPQVFDWDPVDAAEWNKIAVGSAGLLLGSIVFIAGLILYKRKTSGRVLVPTS